MNSIDLRKAMYSGLVYYALALYSAGIGVY